MHLLQVIGAWLSHGVAVTTSAGIAVWEFYRRVFTNSERPLYFVLVDIAPLPGGSHHSRLKLHHALFFVAQPLVLLVLRRNRCTLKKSAQPVC